MRGLFSFLVGFTCGWAARSTVDSPHALGVRMFGLAYDTRGKLSRWAAIEREHITDVLAEARSRCEQGLESIRRPVASPVPPRSGAPSRSPTRSIGLDFEASIIEDG